ncbi:MAG TPA: hypothetical protein VES42_13625 [Pilimelia sp.]|nr:hypothetical protein [Pilimelia sp.]
MPTALAISALLVGPLAGCTGDAGSAPAGAKSPDKPNVLALLVSDAKGSLQKTVATTDKATSVSLTMVGTAAGEKVAASGVVALEDPPKVEITAKDADGTPTVVRMIGSVFYVQIAAKDRASMDGKSWLKMDVAKAGAGANLTRQFDDIDPVRQVKTLLASGTFTVVGEETVGGVQTVHYTTTQPVSTYLRQVDAKLRTSVQKELAKAGVKTVKTDVWIDEKYQPRRVRSVAGSFSDMTVDYGDYGKPVSINAPPAGETADFAELMAGLGDLQNN